MTWIEYSYKNFVRPRLFARSNPDAEIAHEWGLRRLKAMQRSRLQLALARKFLGYYDAALCNNVMGLPFRSPLGLAAGFDKHCEVYHTAVPACGWGFAEI